MNEDIKSFYAAIILSLILIFATNYFFFKKDDVVATPQVNVSQPETETAAADGKDEAKDAVPLSTEEAVAANPGVKISTPALTGSFRTRGFRIDNLWLEKYKQTLSPDSPDVELLTPAKTANPYYAEFGWLAADPAVRLPDAHTLWTVKGRELTDKTPVVLEWDNQQGLKFITKISLDENYLFTVSQSVENNTGKNVTLYPYGLIARAPGAVGGRGVVHEGMIGVMDGTLEEIKYDDVKDENKEFTTTGGWLGFSDRYWFSAIVVNPETESRVKFSKSDNGLYQADFVGAPVTVVPGSVGSDQVMFYAGAKEIKLLDQYTSERRIPKFDLAVDFGWYYFLTKPFFYILDFLYGIIGNMGWAILLFAALLRLVMFPIANKSYESMAKMKKIQPKLKELQEKYSLTYLFISHDLSVVRYISDRICVMYLGNIVELADAATIFDDPRHPYTVALLSSIPTTDPDSLQKERILLEGNIPSPIKPPSGCKFHTRCDKCMDICRCAVPEWSEVEPGHWCACHLYNDAEQQARAEEALKEAKANGTFNEKKDEANL